MKIDRPRKNEYILQMLEARNQRKKKEKELRIKEQQIRD